MEVLNFFLILVNMLNEGHPHVCGRRPQPCVSSLQLVVECPVVIAAAIPGAMLFQLVNVLHRMFPSLYTTDLGSWLYLSWLQAGFSHHTRQGDQYIRDVLQPVVVPHFDNHPLATRLVYMDDNARPHRSRAVTAYLQSEAVTSTTLLFKVQYRM
jgi:hypothetical protein